MTQISEGNSVAITRSSSLNFALTDLTLKLEDSSLSLLTAAELQSFNSSFSNYLFVALPAPLGFISGTSTLYRVSGSG